MRRVLGLWWVEIMLLEGKNRLTYKGEKKYCPACLRWKSEVQVKKFKGSAGN